MTHYFHNHTVLHSNRSNNYVIKTRITRCFAKNHLLSSTCNFFVAIFDTVKSHDISRDELLVLCPCQFKIQYPITVPRLDVRRAEIKTTLLRKLTTLQSNRAKLNQFNVNPQCNIMQITRKKKIEATYTLEGTVLENVDSIKYLGPTVLSTSFRKSFFFFFFFFFFCLALYTEEVNLQTFVTI